MGKNAIQYIRWSTLEQGNADRSSEVRQDDAAHRMAKVYGWTIIERIVDSGRSAFTGENIGPKGELGKLAQRFRSGVLDPKEHVLLIESLDRLSRRSATDMVGWLTPLLSDGLTIGVAETMQLIDHRTMNDIGGFITLITSAFTNHAFSMKQRDRGNAAWNARRTNVQPDGDKAKLTAHRARPWLTWDARKKTYQVNDLDRVWLISEMFRLRLEGWGKSSIAKLFNEAAENDPRYKVWSTSKKKPPTLWTVSAISRIVQDRAVTGFIQYHLSPRGSTKRVPTGDPVKVYPEVIDPETWARANDERLTNQLKAQGRGRSISNIFGPLAKCKECAGTMQALGSSRIRMNKDGSKNKHYFLYCHTSKMTKGKDCNNQRGWSYSKIEKPFLEKLLTLAIDDQYFRVSDETLTKLEGQIVILKRRIEDHKASKKRLLAIITSEDDQEAADAYASVNIALNDTKDELTKAQASYADAKGAVSPAEHITRVAEVRQNMESDDAEERYRARSLVKAAAQDLIREIQFDAKDGVATLSLIDGMGFMRIKHDGTWTYLDTFKDWTERKLPAAQGFKRRRAGKNLTFRNLDGTVKS